MICQCCLGGPIYGRNGRIHWIASPRAPAFLNLGLSSSLRRLGARFAGSPQDPAVSPPERDFLYRALSILRSVSSIQPLTGASSGPWVRPPQPRPCGAWAQATIAIAVDPSADQIGAPESPLQAPASRPAGSAAQMRTVEAGSRTARVTLRKVPPDGQSPSRTAP